MGLANAVAVLVTRLGALDGIDSAPAYPPAQLTNDRTLLVYPVPGASTPQQHAGRTGGIVVVSADTIVVEFHLKIAADRLADGIAAATEMLDALRTALWGEFARDRWGGTVTGLTSVDTVGWVDMGWSSDFTFGCRLNASVSIVTEIPPLIA